jgi:hypothetical protein
MKLNKDIKIEVHSPEHSEAIQKRLFELGIHWIDGSTEIDHPNDPYLYVENGYMTCGILDCVFMENKGTQVTLDDLYNPSFLKKDSCEGKSVVIDGKRYKLVLEE